MNGTGWWLTLRTPAEVQALVTVLRDAGLFPESRTWWFAWNALDIVVPKLLTEEANLNAEWEVLRVFSERIELRLSVRGHTRGCWLLLEGDPAAALGDLYQTWVEGMPRQYEVELGHRLLAGQKLQLPDRTTRKEKWKEKERGEILYRRILNYGSDDSNLDQALVAHVRNYYDEMHRLVTVRYHSIESVVPGSIEVEPFPSPEEMLNLAL
jgi:hypothetical protein